MPPKPKITRDMIADAAFDIARTESAEQINARSVSSRLNCSTQPVLYHFQTMDELKQTVYHMADSYHSQFLLSGLGENPMLALGLNYIRFGAEEKHLFRLLFQSNEFGGSALSDLMESPELEPMLEMLSTEAQLSKEQAKTVFRSLFLLVHGYAAMLANNDMVYDKSQIESDLTMVFQGIMLAVKGEKE